MEGRERNDGGGETINPNGKKALVGPEGCKLNGMQYANRFRSAMLHLH